VDDLVPPFNHLADEPFAVALPVGERGVYEVQAKVYGPVQGPKRLIVPGTKPLSLADSLRPIADFRDLQPRSAEPPVVHVSSFTVQSAGRASEPSATVERRSVQQVT
jgi:hypothetical protein